MYILNYFLGKVNRAVSYAEQVPRAKSNGSATNPFAGRCWIRKRCILMRMRSAAGTLAEREECFKLIKK
jgi:hypothetical protein